MKRAPKWSVCLLWGMVAVRLLFPISLESAFSVIPDYKPIPTEEFEANTEEEILKEQETNYNFNSEISESITDEKPLGNDSVSSRSDNEKSFKEHFVNNIGIFSGMWLVGMFVLLTYAVLSFVGLKRKVAASICLYDNVYICDEIDSPFVLGIVKPHIYLSSQTPSEVWEPILKHERVHLGRGDHIWKLLGFFLMAVYWFYPLSWVAYILFCKDMELACDEKATKDMDKGQRADYCEALLKCSVNSKTIEVCPVAFGEVGVKSRIKMVLNYKKPSFWVMAFAVVTCIMVSVCFLTNPKKEESVLKYLDMSYGEYQKEMENEAEFLHGEFYVGKLGSEGIFAGFSGTGAEIVYTGEYNEELAGYELSENSMAVRIQGALRDLVELDEEQLSEAELIQKISEQYGNVIAVEYCEGAGTAYYVSDHYIRILVDLKEDESENIIFEITVGKQNGSEKVFLADADTWISREEDNESISENEKDEDGYIWLSDEVYIYEFNDLDQNGVEEYVEVYHAENESEYFCRFTFYWNGEAIYEYDDPCRIFPGNAEYLDLDGDGQKEVFFPFYPAVNSMPLVEYIVLKQKEDLSWKPLEMIHGETMTDNAFPISIAKGKNEWEAVISCGDLEKKEIFDLKFYYTKLEEQFEKEESEYKEYLKAVINDYKKGFPEESEWRAFGSVCAWGIWNITSGEYQGQPCLIATHGIQGYDKFDLWGELDVYFNYDEQGKTRFLDMEFRNSESWDDTGQQTKEEFTMEDLIALCDAGSEKLKSALTDFSEDVELPYSNFEKKVYEYNWSYFCYLSYEEREYRLQVSYELSDQYGFRPNELIRVDLYYPETRDGQLLYASEERFPYDPPIYNMDIRSFLEREYDIHQFVEIKLPEGLELGNYRADMCIGNEGYLFTGDYEEQPHGDYTPEEWYAPGGIEFIQKEYFPGDIIFEDGKLKEVFVLMNHSGVSSEFEILEGCGMQAVLCEYFCDLFTLPDAEEYKQEHGLLEEEFKSTSNYWYVFFAEPDSEYVYVLYLNQEYFEKEDIVELARSVEFKVK